MLKKLAAVTIQCRGIKNKVDIKWVRPEFIPHHKPEKSGDLEPVPPIPDNTLGLYYSLSDEIKDAPDSVKKLFSVAFLKEKDYHDLVKKNIIDRVKRHKYDFSSAEAKIAKITARIRFMQDIIEKDKKNTGIRVQCQELIDRRKKLLKYLRMYDYKKFEWLLEKLNIEYKSHPDSPHRLSRKESLKKLTEMHCEDIRNRKLLEYKNLLKCQQGPFLLEKLKTLKFIRSEQMELQLPITVTEQDINAIEKQYQEWKAEDEKLHVKKKRDSLLFD